jgi:hypothetical protein
VNMIEAMLMARYDGYEAAMDRQRVSPDYKDRADLSQQDYEALQDELGRWRTWCTDAQLMRDAYSRENDQLRAKLRRAHDMTCNAHAACDAKQADKARDILRRLIRFLA